MDKHGMNVNPDWQPNKKSAAILDRAWQHVQSVSYKVTLRWLFYRLLQDGFYSGKSDYGAMVQLFSRARCCFYENWHPATLSDEGRRAIPHGAGEHATVEDWIAYITKGNWACNLDHFYQQEYYVEAWFEANAMAGQFRQHTNGITLRPMGGQPSIPYKWQAAKELEVAAQKYGKPVVVLYFGDLDDKGSEISDTIENEVSQWCSVGFEFVRCGLTIEQVNEYNVPENFEHPGAYQWEALTDGAAGEIIEGCISEYLDEDVAVTTSEGAEEAENLFNEYVAGFSEYYESHKGDVA